MNLYPLELKLQVLAKRLAIAMRLMHPPILTDRKGTPIKGVNARYHGDSDESGFDCVVRAGITGKQQLSNIPLDVKVIVLIETLDKTLVDSLASSIILFPNVIAVELGNEIDLTEATYRDFADFIAYGYTTLRFFGFKGDIITGGVSRVRPDTLEWLSRALTTGYLQDYKDLVVGIHRYSISNNASLPQPGYVSRDEECNTILKVANGRRIAITEFGYPLLDGFSPADLDQVVTNYQTDLDYFSRMGASYAIAYQWLDGPTNTSIDRFGIRALPEIQALLRT